MELLPIWKSLASIKRVKLSLLKTAMDLNIDYLLGGTHPESVAPIVKDHPIKYYPFVGKIDGHPSILKGNIAEISKHADTLTQINGVDGIDLLAYRFDGDVPKLIEEVCNSSRKPVIIAGSIDRKERVEIIKQSCAISFTVGTAAFENQFEADKAGLSGQLNTIMRITEK